MKGLAATLIAGALVGAAVAGTIYYLSTNEEARRAIGKVKERAGDVLGKVNWKAAGRVAGTVAQQAI